MRATQKSFWFILLVSLMLGLGEFGLLVYSNLGGYGFSNTSNQYARDLMSMQLSAYWPLIRFSIALIVVHVLFAVIVYFIARFLIINVKKFTWFSASLFSIVLAYICVLLFNSNYYPASYFALSYLGLSENNGICTAAFFLAAIVSACLLAMFFLGVLSAVRHRKTVIVSLGVIIFILIAASYWSDYRMSASERGRLNYTNKQPNIIVIMYCSMRADIFAQTPNFSSYARDSLWFQEGYVPVTRSGPSTYATMSSLYPADSGYFFNLSEMNPRVKFKNLLPQILAQNGYQTLLVTNINLFRRTDEKYNWGFQVIDAAPHNVFAFFIPRVSDIPLVNVLTNFSFSKWLFDYSYNNVEDTVHYKFQHFNNRLQHVLKYKLESRPVFMLINDEVMHFPYSVPGRDKKLSMDAYLEIYKSSDQHFPQYLDLLKKYKLLDNAVVIVTADHGESFGSYFPNDGPFQFHSHGNTAISQGEFHVPFVYHFYTNDSVLRTARVINGNVSTLDIMPTVLALLNIQAPPLDGVSLLPVLENKAPVDANRILFRQAELSFQVPQSGSAEEAIKALAKEKLNTYQVNKLGEVGLKVSAADKARLEIEYSAYLGDILLAYLPRGFYLLINFKEKKYVAFKALGLEMEPDSESGKKLAEVGLSAADFSRMYEALHAYILKAHQPSVGA